MSEQSKLHPAPAWSRMASRLTLKPLAGAAHGGEALDRQLIAERIYRYGWAYDERDRSLFADCFTDDVIWEGNVMGLEPVGPFRGREAVVDWNCQFWPNQDDQRRHLFTNVTIDDLTAETATADAYLLLTSAMNSSIKPVTTGPYRLELLKEDTWKIHHLWSSFDAPF
ncbi:MAG: nuclear transport factor 2 family protein [Sulfobacillus sp.]